MTAQEQVTSNYERACDYTDPLCAVCHRPRGMHDLPQPCGKTVEEILLFSDADDPEISAIVAAAEAARKRGDDMMPYTLQLAQVLAKRTA